MYTNYTDSIYTSIYTDSIFSFQERENMYLRQDF